MRKLGWFIIGVAWIILSLLGRMPYCEAQLGSLTGFCTQGAFPAKVSGLNSANTLQGVVPKCIVTVYYTGTTNKATLYADPTGTVLGNPFTADTTGRWLLYSLSASCYDIVMSGGTAPNAYPSPYTLTSQCSNAPQPANVYNINSIVPYVNLGAAIAGVDILMGSGPGKISVNTPGALGTTPTLSPGHDLYFAANPILDVPIRVTSDNTLSCAGGVLVSSTISTLNVGGDRAAILMPSGADKITVQDCKFDMAANVSGAYILGLDFNANNYGYATNVRVLNTTAHNMSNLLSSSFGDPTHPSKNIEVSGTTVTYDLGAAAPDADTKVTGCADGVSIHGNRSYYSTYIFEGFGIDAGTNPSYAALQASCLKNITLTGNIFRGVYLGQGVGLWWGSGLFQVISSGNDADGCGDICYDPEGSAQVRISDMATNFRNGAAAPCYSTGYFNSVQGSNFTATGDNPLILIKNNQLNAANCSHISVIGNVLTAVGTNGAAIAHLENTAYMEFSDNKGVDGTFDNVGVAEFGRFTGNSFTFTHAIRNGFALQMPTVYQSEIAWSNNDVRTTVSQGSLPCLIASPNDASGGNTYYLDGGHCFGPWTVGLVMGTTAGANNYNLHGMGLPFVPSSPTYGSYFHSGNYVLNSSTTF